MEKKNKEIINSILLANWYLITCEFNNKSNSQNEAELARKFLTSRISKALTIEVNNTKLKPLI